jgi:nucleoside-diphosphate-sugar epimerase
MKTLVTGGTGFIGARLVETLRARGEDVVCLAKDAMNTADLKALGVEVVLADLNNGVAWDRMLDGVGRVYHLAGATRACRMGDYYTENHLATKRFVEICARMAPSLERFVYVSSQTAAGPSVTGDTLTEDAPCRPVSHYGRSKLLAEGAVRDAAGTLRTTIVRPTAVYGPRDRELLEYFKLIKHGVHVMVGRGRKVMNFIHVDDLVDGILLAGEHPRAVGETYFLGSEESYSTEAIGDAIARALRKTPLRVHLPHAAVYMIGAISELTARIEGKRVLFNIQKVRESTQDAWICSVAKARSQMGFRAKVEFADGVESTYRWYKEHRWL